MAVAQRPKRRRRRPAPITGAERRRLRDLAVAALRRNDFEVDEVAAVLGISERWVREVQHRVEAVAVTVVGEVDDD